MCKASKSHITQNHPEYKLPPQKMFDIPLRSLKDRLIDPVSHLIPPSLSPNTLTFTAFIFGLLSCAAAALSHPAFSVTLWLINRGLDCLDGAVARHRGVASELGAFLDLLSDFVIYSLIPICVAFGRETASVRSGDSGISGVSGELCLLSTWKSLAILE
jgi:hypothetical protein